MTITASEIYRLQKIIDNCQTVILLSDKAERENYTEMDEGKIINLLENTTEQFYLINEEIFTRRQTKC